MTNVQKNLSKATIALARCADDLAKININKERLTSLTDAMILLGHTHKSVTNLRRDLMRYVLSPGFKTLCDTTTEASHTLLYGDDIKLCDTTTEASHTLLYGGDIKQSLVQTVNTYLSFFRTREEGESKPDRLSPLCHKIQNEQKSLKSQVSALFTSIEQVREYLLSKKLHFEGGQIRHCIGEE